jgi:hypothetical protein
MRLDKLETGFQIKFYCQFLLGRLGFAFVGIRVIGAQARSKALKIGVMQKSQKIAVGTSLHKKMQVGDICSAALGKCLSLPHVSFGVPFGMKLRNWKLRN